MKKTKTFKSDSPTKEISGGDALSPSLAGAGEVSSPFIGQENNMKTKQAAHTPGTWTFQDDPDTGDRVVIDENLMIVCMRPTEANARLIAASPLLLNALRNLVMAIGTEHQGRAEVEAVKAIEQAEGK